MTVRAMEDDLEAFRGKYCLLKITPPLPPKKGIITFEDVLVNLNGSEWENSWLQSEIIPLVWAFYFWEIFNGVCVPSTCTPQDINYVFNNRKSLANYYCISD